MIYTLGQASKATGISKPTLSKAIKNGKISASKDEKGVFAIEPVELHRVFPMKHKQPLRTVSVETIGNPQDNGLLQARLDAALEQVEDLRQQRDAWQEQAQRLALVDHRPKGFWSRLRR